MARYNGWKQGKAKRHCIECGRKLEPQQVAGELKLCASCWNEQVIEVTPELDDVPNPRAFGLGAIAKVMRGGQKQHG